MLLIISFLVVFHFLIYYFENDINHKNSLVSRAGELPRFEEKKLQFVVILNIRTFFQPRL